MVSSISQITHLFFGFRGYDKVVSPRPSSVLETKVYSLHEHVVSIIEALKSADVNDFSYLSKLLEKLQWIQKKIWKLEKKLEGSLEPFFSFKIFTNTSESKALAVFKTRIDSDVDALQKANHELHIKVKIEDCGLMYPEDIELFEKCDRSLSEQIAELYARLDNREQALLYYQKAIEGNPENVSLVRRYVDYLISIREFTKAQSLLESLNLSTGNDLDSGTLLKMLEVQIGMGNFFESAELALSGIINFPFLDIFKEKFVDAYIIEMDRTGFGVFKNNFFLIYHYFSTKSCYLQIARSSLDAVEIGLDLFDYIARRSFGIFPLYKKFIAEFCRDEQSCKVIQEYMERHCEFFLERHDLMVRKIEDLQELLQNKKKFSSIDDTRFFAKSIKQIEEYLIGGKLGEISKGYIPTIGFYLKLLNKQKNVAEYKTKFEPIYEKLKIFKENFQKLLQKLKGNGTSESITELFVNMKNIFESKSNATSENFSAELSLQAWNKRLNLYRYIQYHLVPKDFQEITRFLQIHEIDLEKLFSTDLIEACQSEPQDSFISSEIHEVFTKKGILKIDDLKNYVNSCETF